MTSDFVSMDWDLQAIVRGCSTEASIDSVLDSPQSYINFSPLLSPPQQDVIFKFPDVSETKTIWDELEELYKPFYPQTLLTTATTSISVSTEVNKNTKKPRKQQPPPPKLSDSVSTTKHPAAELKKGRKNQHKSVAQKVITADGLACDKWAWRKYGQKPIKGSSHPRSYYRCSSSKGCLARKQVERSSTDPGVFIVTYSAEHNHSHPTRRSSLAGSTRNKASVMARGAAKINEQLELKKEEDKEDELVMPDLILSDELFPSLEDLEGLLLDQSLENNISDNSWFIDESVNL